VFHTPLCARLGIAYPIFSVGMGPVAGPVLAATVSNAGACGVLGGVFLPASDLRQASHQLRTLTDKPFGVNLILPLMQEEQIEACLAERVPLLVLFWGGSQALCRRGSPLSYEGLPPGGLCRGSDGSRRGWRRCDYRPRSRS